MYLLMVCITLIYYAARFLSNGLIDLYMFLPVLLIQIMAVTWSRLLVLGKQIKYHTYVMVGILNMSIFWGPIIYDFFVLKHFDKTMIKIGGHWMLGVRITVLSIESNAPPR